MSLAITSTYAGEVLESLLAKAVTGNDVVDGGHIYVKSGIQKAFTLPRISVDNLIQDQAATPSSSVGTFTIDERKLVPDDFMVYTEFNPREFESFWRPFQPSGNLVFRDLPSNVQVSMLSEVLKSVSTYMGKNILAGDKLGAAPDDKFDGIITKALADSAVIDIATPVALTEANIQAKLKLVVDALPKVVTRRPDFKIFVSYATRELYRDSIHNNATKGSYVETDTVRQFLGHPVVELAGMDDDTIFATYAGANRGSNLWVGVDTQSDDKVIEVEKKQANSELYFFKMLMKADTQIAWGEHCALYKV